MSVMFRSGQFFVVAKRGGKLFTVSDCDCDRHHIHTRCVMSASSHLTRLQLVTTETYADTAVVWVRAQLPMLCCMTLIQEQLTTGAESVNFDAQFNRIAYVCY